MDKTDIRIIEGYEHIPYNPLTYPAEKMLRRSSDLYSFASKRRSVRSFSKRKVPREVLLNIIRTAGT